MRDKKLTWEEAVLWLKQQPDQAELVRACFYDDPLLDAAIRYLSSSEWQAVKKLLPELTGKALDIGSGRGISAYALARDGWKTVALEPNSSNLVGAGAIRNLVADTGLNIQVVEEWGEKLPFPDGSFDLVHCRQVLHHANDLGLLCKEIGRVLKPGGVFIATREHVISSYEDLPQFLSSHPLHYLYGGEYAYLLSEYLTAIKSGGIKLVKVLNPNSSDINLYPETLTGLKKRISSKMHIPIGFIPQLFLSFLGVFNKTPGRLYTFLGQKI